MTRRTLLTLTALPLLGLTALAAGAHAAAPAASTRALDPPGLEHAFLYSINNRGEIVGQGFDESGAGFGLHSSEGSFTIHSYDAFGWTQLGAINDHGEIVGSRVVDDTYRELPFTLGPDGPQDAAVDPGTFLMVPAGLNDRGDMAGVYTDQPDFGNIRAFVRIDGVTEVFSYPEPGVSQTQAFAITDSGEVVGYYVDSARSSHGFVRRGDEYQRIDVPGATLTRAFGMNNRGEIVGYFRSADRLLHGFILRGDELTVVDHPGALGTALQGINDHGDFVGYYRDSDGIFHGMTGHR